MLIRQLVAEKESGEAVLTPKSIISSALDVGAVKVVPSLHSIGWQIKRLRGCVMTDIIGRCFEIVRCRKSSGSVYKIRFLDDSSENVTDIEDFLWEQEFIKNARRSIYFQSRLAVIRAEKVKIMKKADAMRQRREKMDASYLASLHGIPTRVLLRHPDLLEAMRDVLKLKREFNKTGIKHEKSNQH